MEKNLQTLHSLQLKIMTGYILLVTLFLSVIIFIYRENTSLIEIDQRAKAVLQQRKLAEDIAVQMLDLALMGEQGLAWDEEDITIYKKKKDTVISSLHRLNEQLRNPDQKKCINSIIELLPAKEMLILSIQDDWYKIRGTHALLQSRIPIIVRNNQQQQEKLTLQIRQNYETNEEKTGGFLGMFRSKKKSRYKAERENREILLKNQSYSENMLRALGSEIARTHMENTEQLLVHVDSLGVQNCILNKEMYRLTNEFNRISQKIQQKTTDIYLTEQRRSIKTISGLGIGAVLLACLFYQLLQRDLKKRHKIHMELEQSNKKNEELLFARKKMMLAIAHDLRSPLAAIKGCAELLPREKDKIQQEEYAKNIQHSSDYMLTLVNTLIDFYLLDTGRSKPNISIFQLDSFFNEIVQCYNILAQKKKLKLTSEFFGLDVVVSGDRSGIRQILDNLLSNAIKFTQEGNIHLNAEYVNGELRFGVKDTGVGITEEEKERIFIAFERLDNARNMSGFGLGLAVSAKLVSRMAGTITVKSKPQEGSTFMVFLPLPPANGLTQIDEENIFVDLRLEGIKVLVIDDDRIQLNITKEMLVRNKISCDCCQTSWELITKLRTQEYELLISDIQMPETDGYGILELLRSSNMELAKTIPVLAVTAGEEDESKYVSYGFAGCIHKPFSMDELLNAIIKVANRKDSRTWKPDFSLIFSGEDNRQEMLQIFITETEKDLKSLIAALKKRDKKSALSILHKNLPLWETVRLDYPLSHLRNLVTCTAKIWTEEEYMEIRKIIKAVKRLVTYAKKYGRLTYENNSDYRG